MIHYKDLEPNKKYRCERKILYVIPHSFDIGVGVGVLALFVWALVSEKLKKAQAPVKARQNKAKKILVVFLFIFNRLLKLKSFDCRARRCIIAFTTANR